MRQFIRAGIYAVPHFAPIVKSGTAKLSATGSLVPIVANQYRDSATFSATGGLGVTGQVATTVTLSASGNLVTGSKTVTETIPTVKFTATGKLTEQDTWLPSGGGGTGNVVVKFNAQQLQDTIGVVVHPTYSGYNTGSLNPGMIITTMVDMGITHYRTAVFPTSPNTTVQNFFDNARAAGLMANVLVDKTWGSGASGSAIWSAMVSRWTLAGVASAEGPNEIDSQSGFTMAQGKTLQHTAYTYFKAQSSWGSRPFIMPSMAQTTGYAAYGTDTYLDYLTLHAYERHFHTMPEDGRLVEWQTAAAAVSSMKKWFNTEHGYVNGVGNQDGGTNAWVPADVAGDYFVRAFVYDAVIAGVYRSFIYELFDDANASSLREQTFGLVDKNGNPKASYTRIKNFLGRLNDTGTGAAPTKVGYTVGSTGSDVQVVPISRTDGTFDLMIWRATSIWDYNATTPITVTPVNVPITLPAAKKVVQYTPDNNVTTTISNSAVTFNIAADGRMKMVRIS